MAYLDKLTPEEKKVHYKKVAEKRAKTISEKYGDNFWKEIGSLGGKVTRGYKFAHGKISPSEAGKMSRK